MRASTCLFALVFCGCLPDATPPPPDAALPPRVLEITQEGGSMRVAAEAPLAPGAAEILRDVDRVDDDVFAALSRATPPRWLTALVVDAHATPDEAGLLLTPRAPLEDGAYMVVVSPDARAIDGRIVTGVPLIERFLVVTPPPRARLVATIPADGSASVPPAIPSLAIAFDGPLGSLGGISLTREDAPVTASISLASCVDLGVEGITCVAIAPSSSLARGARYALVCDGARDAEGGDVPAARSEFETATGDLGPLTLTPLSCALDELDTPVGCVLAMGRRVTVRVQASRAATMRLASGPRATTHFAPRGEALLVVDRDVDEQHLSLSVRDLGGEALGREALLAPALDVPPLVVSEVYGDPLGPEPDQELVEIANLGLEPIALGGFTLTDDPFRPGDPIPEVTLPGGAALLIVGPRFRAESELDPPIPAGALLVRLASSLGTGGLTNRGEEIVLRDAGGQRVAHVPAVPFEPGRCLVRDGEAYRIGECTPGRVEGLP